MIPPVGWWVVNRFDWALWLVGFVLLVAFLVWYIDYAITHH
jgi:hypothetical protein